MLRITPRPKRAQLLKAFAGSVLILAVGITAVQADDKPMPRSVTVTGSGSVEAQPDRARITSGVTTEALSAREAVSANNEAMSKVIAALKAKGIDAKDIQTSSLNVDPLIDYGKDNQSPKIRGYRVSNQVTVIVRDLDALGSILDAVVGAGANQIQGLVLEVSNSDVLKDKARQEAVANALRRAKLLATAAGAEVGEILQISEETTGGSAPLGGVRFAKADMAVPVERGTMSLEASVTATWALK